MTWTKKVWLKCLGLVCLVILLCGCCSEQANFAGSKASSFAVQQLSPENLASIPILANAANPEIVSVPSSPPLIPVVVTPDEISLREQQVQIAKEIEQDRMRANQAGVATYSEFRQATYSRLSSEIQLLQARQLLQLKQQQEVK